MTLSERIAAAPVEQTFVDECPLCHDTGWIERTSSAWARAVSYIVDECPNCAPLAIAAAAVKVKE